MSILKLLASDGFLSVNKHIARIVGLDAAVLLAELASSHNYFEVTEQLTDDGMFFETVDRIEENTTLSKYQQSKVVNVLVEAGILETKKIGIPAKRYFKINEQVVLNLLDDKRLKNLTTVSKKNEPLEVKKVDCNNNIDNKKENNKRFTPPTVEEVRAYCIERNNNVDAERFVNYYESKGWLIGKTKMKSWKAAVRTWEHNSYGNARRGKADELEESYRMYSDWASS